MTQSAQTKHFGKFLVVVLTAATASMLFAFLGTPLLRVLRNVYGATRYWLAGAVLSGGLVLLFPEGTLFPLLLLSFWMTVGVYQEFEERGHGHFWTAALSVTLGTLILIFGAQAWSQAMGVDLQEAMNASWKEMMTKGGVVANQTTENHFKTLLLSALILIQISSLAFALMLDRKMALLVGLRFEKVASQMRVHEFRIPDIFVWITMAALLGVIPGIANAETVLPVAMTVLITMIGLYFFQGLAVLEVSFLVFRIGSLMRLLVYLIVVGWLPFLLSAVGFIDYWANFRQRMRNWKLSKVNPKNGENI